MLNFKRFFFKLLLIFICSLFIVVIIGSVSNILDLFGWVLNIIQSGEIPEFLKQMHNMPNISLIGAFVSLLSILFGQILILIFIFDVIVDTIKRVIIRIKKE